MQRNCKLIVAIIALTASSICAFAQENVEYRDVILDGKPAKLNVATGKITLVNPEDKKVKKPIETTEQPKTSTAYVVNSSDFHTVHDDETLFDISKKYDVSLTQLKQANNLETTLVNKGQTLRVKNFDAVSDSNSYIITTAENAYEATTPNFHIVKSGETLFSLSQRYNLTVNELKVKNNLNTNIIKIGQKLRIRDFGLVNDDDDISVWTVKKGDTLFNIAKRSGTTVSAIKQLNGLTSNIITVGQILQLK